MCIRDSYKARPARILKADLAKVKRLLTGNGFYSNGHFAIHGDVPKIPMGFEIENSAVIARVLGESDPYCSATPTVWRDGEDHPRNRFNTPRVIRMNSMGLGPVAHVNAHYFDLIRKVHPLVQFYFQHGKKPAEKALVGMVGSEIVALLMPLTIDA